MSIATAIKVVRECLSCGQPLEPRIIRIIKSREMALGQHEGEPVKITATCPECRQNMGLRDIY